MRLYHVYVINTRRANTSVYKYNNAYPNNSFKYTKHDKTTMQIQEQTYKNFIQIRM